MKKIIHNADKKNVNTLKDLHEDYLDFELSRAQAKQIQTQVFSTNVPNSPTQKNELTQEQIEFPTMELSDILDYDGIPTVNVTSNALKVLIANSEVYTGETGSEYLNDLRLINNEEFTETIDTIYHKLNKLGQLTSAIESLNENHFDNLVQAGVLEVALLDKTYNFDSDSEENTVYKISGENKYDNLINISIKKEIPISLLPDSIRSKIYNKLGSKGSIGSELDLAAPDMTPLGDDVESNYAQTKEQFK